MKNRLKKLNKIQRLSLVMIVLLSFCMLAGTTGAWVTSQGSKKNVFGLHDYYVDIALQEPNWESVGRSQALTMQPGMDIFKDPCVKNITEDSCFVRLKIVIADLSGNDITDTDRGEFIIKRIAYCTDDNNTPEVYDDTFTYYTDLNSDFEYSDGYFYYTGGNSYCLPLAKGETTTPLFTDVLIPTLSTEYAYFSDGFIITVEAEAVFSSGLKEQSASVANVAARFSGEYVDSGNSISLTSLGDNTESGQAVMTSFSIAEFSETEETEAVNYESLSGGNLEVE